TASSASSSALHSLLAKFDTNASALLGNRGCTWRLIPWRGTTQLFLPLDTIIGPEFWSVLQRSFEVWVFAVIF
uniref:Uncharacterized protein n=1 Tax=Oryza brachyantha TaxID=4533 RepID=J3LXA3_ORYBR